MPWIVLIKTANTEFKEVGDLVGVYPQDHQFSQIEMEDYIIREITSFTRQEIVDWLNNNMPERRRIYRLSVANQWTNEVPEKKTAWNDNGTWRFLKTTPKYSWNFGNFTGADAAILADLKESRTTKLALFQSKIRFRMQELTENQTEVL